MAAMNESTLKALLEAEQSDALGHLTSEVSKERAKAMDYYLGRPFGNEVDGQSQVVSSDVADVIEWIMPALMKIFMSGDEVVSPAPHGAEDEEAAKQAGDYANYVFTRDNPGFTILYTMFKDALLQKTGTVKVYWEEKEVEETDEFISIPDDQFMMQSQQRMTDGWELKDHSEEPAPQDMMAEAMPMPGMEMMMQPMLHTGVWTRKKKTGKVCIDPVPPEEFLISRRAKSIEEAAYVSHRTQKTASELIEAGYPKKKIDELPEDEASTHSDLESLSRDRGEEMQDASADYSVANRAMRKIWVTEAYIKVDWDDDGIAEMRKITHAGSGTIILDNEPWDGPRPFCGLTPIIMSHRFHGRSVADLVLDLQLLKSTLLRQMLDNLYLTNNPRKIVDPQSVEMDDLLVNRIGGLVRTKNGADSTRAVFPLIVENTAAASFPMLQYIDEVRENRTGVTKYNQGTDANSLNKTASGINQIMSASQQRIELIARVFAETGVTDMFKLIIWLLRRYPDQAKRTIRLRNKQWVEMDPAQWPGDFDMTPNVGLGTGNKDQMLGHLMTILGVQMQAIQLQGGIQGPLVTVGNLYSTLSKLPENAGFKNAADFFTDPNPPEGEGQPPPPQQEPPPDPAMMKAQADIEAGQAKAEADKGIKQQDADLKYELAMKDFDLKADLAMKEFDLKRDLAMGERDMKLKTAREESDIKMEPVAAQGDMLTNALAGVAQIIADMQRNTAEIIAQGNQQIVAAMTAPKTVVTPDGRQLTVTTGAVN